jgi:endonuclease-3
MFGDKPKCELEYSSDIDLLVAIVLSAQCTDKRVNLTTRDLFAKYKSAEDYAGVSQEELEYDLRSINFFRNKAQNIRSMCKVIVEKHGGRVPTNFDDLVALAGVGRKTANVFLSEFCRVPALAVDTHVMRVARRLGLSSGKTPVEIEDDLVKLFDRDNLCDYHLYLVLFGRYMCIARKPNCDICKLAKIVCQNSKDGVI